MICFKIVKIAHFWITRCDQTGKPWFKTSLCIMIFYINFIILFMGFITPFTTELRLYCYSFSLWLFYKCRKSVFKNVEIEIRFIGIRFHGLNSIICRIYSRKFDLLRAITRISRFLCQESIFMVSIYIHSLYNVVRI